MGFFEKLFGKKKSKKGQVYGWEGTTSTGKKVIYTGQTSRPVYKRVGEHIKAVKSQNTNHYAGRFKKIKLLGAIPTNNRYSTEKTVKRMSSTQKRRLFRSGAQRYKRSRQEY